MTNDEIKAFTMNVLLDNWVVKGTGSWQDYEAAKNLVSRSRDWTPGEYSDMIWVVFEYVGV